MNKQRLHEIFRSLYKTHGPQHWWPARDRFEVMVGAVLTQNTAWVNVERAIEALERAGALDPHAILDLSDARLARLIRPSGYFNVKAARLKSLCRWYVAKGGWQKLRHWPTGRLREALLSVHGIGPETADDIILYAFERPVFVVDAYTRRLLGRLGHTRAQAPYDDLRTAIETALGPDTTLYNEYHALIVTHAKHVCRPKPLCGQCELKRGCAFQKGKGSSDF
ncbi:endonuclease [Thioalkalivibrio denitrificans]|uniref:Endonuclease n=1 Tax=Thioalkalivibrio denitrificans TaxID=108003 RepID=A0A1V3NLE4_9GAMM|nr:endonuclease III domain-containing protein [Thioalkalivibrio denitrificans]OOG25939.1 endonuclease [Thioalkalivibrio denitrificans]